ncbi:MAG: LysM peptidoglycan-binding domain-containing protein [Burkholderiales bacterium]|nr:LysM peptidoglycan-binding domain-containing protein [Burkholderiales bacterium]
MSIRNRRCTRSVLRLAAACAAVAALQGSAMAQAAGQLPVLPQWRATAQHVAQAGIPLSELAANAPDSHVVQRGDTLWGISGLFLKSPWRWPELWGMNLDQIRNPHLIYPGQILVLEKKDGRASLRVAKGLGQEPTNTVRLSPRVRGEVLDNGAIASIPLNSIGPFLNEAVVFDANTLASAPRIVATQEGRVLVSRGETAYVRGDLHGATDFRLFRELKPLVDPETRQVLGFEGRYVGTAVFVRSGGIEDAGNGKGVVVPDTFRITSTTLEAGVGDRLSPVPQQELVAYVPHAPAGKVECRIVSVYGDGLNAGQNQVVSINRGKQDGLERGNVLALWRAGAQAVDTTDGQKTKMHLPDERHGLLFVFRVFDRVSYALILNVQEPVSAGDRCTSP